MNPNPMPIPPVLPINNIPGFLAQVEQLFDEIAGSWSPILFKEKFRLFISNAWNEIKLGMRTPASTLASITNSFNNLATAVLDEAGLAGAQLQLKLEGLNDAWKRFNENGTVRFLKHLLGWINSILGSLAAVIPPAETWKEFKEAIEKLIEPTE